MAEYARHYNGRRPHRARRLQPSRPDHPVADLSQERVKRRPVLGGLLSEYERAGRAQVTPAGTVLAPHRVRPGHKLAAVRALQAGGHVVAMVGDGVNDVQALKQADLGIAMGSGSQASCSAARVVLLDGTFAAIPRMLDEGRRVIANIERVAGHSPWSCRPSPSAPGWPAWYWLPSLALLSGVASGRGGQPWRARYGRPSPDIGAGGRSARSALRITATSMAS